VACVGFHSPVSCVSPLVLVGSGPAVRCVPGTEVVDPLPCSGKRGCPGSVGVQTQGAAAGVPCEAGRD
jgi:hypothetical protein